MYGRRKKTCADYLQRGSEYMISVKIILGAIIAFALIFTARLVMLAMESRSIEPNIGLVTGMLRDCEDKPNCVFTGASRPEQRLAPFPLTEPRDVALARWRKVLEKASGGTLKQDRDGYLHAEFRSQLFGFVDDVEILILAGSDQVQIRSASRVGYSDLNANRKRVQSLLEDYKQTPAI